MPRNFLHRLISGLVALTQLPAFAVVFSRPVQPGTSREQVIIELDGHGMCTGTIVGAEPVTVLTAAHCLQRPALVQYIRGTREAPRAVFDNSVIYANNIGASHKDLAVLVYPNTLQLRDVDTWNVATVASLADSGNMPIEFCGYGYTDLTAGRGDLQKLNCGQNSLESGRPTSVGDAYWFSFFQRILRQFPELLLVSAGLSRDVRGDFAWDERKALLNAGDSGSPAFREDSRGRVHVMGVASLSFTENARNRVTGNVFSPLASPENIQTMERAVRKYGADIQGLDALKSSLRR